MMPENDIRSYFAKNSQKRLQKWESEDLFTSHELQRTKYIVHDVRFVEGKYGSAAQKPRSLPVWLGPMKMILERTVYFFRRPQT